MHLESAGTDLSIPSPPLDRRDKPAAGKETDQRPAREGLPPAFKMRRDRHYVEQLMGDAPLRTVREIPVSDIEPPDDETADIDALRHSIRDVGILQPLLVSPQGNRFRIIAGANRYRAAVLLGLHTVPCLVYDAGDDSVDALREAAARRAAPPAASEPLGPRSSVESAQSQPVAGLRDVTARLAFVSAVMPALDVAGYDPLRWNILTDLMKVELERARSTAAAVEWLAAPSPAPVREKVEAAALLDAVLEAVGPEARLQGVKLDISGSLSGYKLSAARGMVVRGLTALVQTMLALSPAGSTLKLNCSGTTVRPALIVEVTQDDCAISTAAAERFFDPGFAEHPGGASGALVLGGVAHVARLHGGRAHARAHERGCTATFVVPKPLEDIDES